METPQSYLQRLDSAFNKVHECVKDRIKDSSRTGGGHQSELGQIGIPSIDIGRRNLVELSHKIGQTNTCNL